MHHIDVSSKISFNVSLVLPYQPLWRASALERGSLREERVGLCPGDVRAVYVLLGALESV